VDVGSSLDVISEITIEGNSLTLDGDFDSDDFFWVREERRRLEVNGSRRVGDAMPALREA